MKYFLILLCVFSMSYAEWNPEYCLMDEDISVLQDAGFVEMKSKVCAALKNTWCSEEKANLLMDLTMVTRPKVCVEIGAFVGSSVLPVAATLQIMNEGQMYAVDAWSNTIACRFLDDTDPNKAWWSTVDMNAVKGMFDHLMNEWMLEKTCVVMHNPSKVAVNEIGEIDFLHIDGDYSTKGSMEDVTMYVPKVREGGYILFSNLYTMVNGKQPRLKAFCKLFESCEMICSIEKDNAILFRKN